MKVTLSLIIFLALLNTAFSQKMESDGADIRLNGSKTTAPPVNRNNVIKASDKKMLLRIDAALSEINVITPFTELRTNLFPQQRKVTKEVYNFDLINSVNNNVKFGGFYGNYVNIFYNPSMYIQPSRGVQVYALHQNSILIPFDKIRENVSPLIFETAAMVGVENAVNYFFNGSPTLKSIFNFFLKHAALYLIKSLTDDKATDRLEGYDYYYCSLGITF